MTDIDPRNHSASGRALLGDHILLVAIACAAAVSLGLGMQFVEMGLAFAATALLAAVAVLAWSVARGTTASRYVLALVLMSFVALHIQLARGMIELHFGVFVALALLLVYMDWGVIVCAAVFVAAHHLLFDRLQAAGLGFWCTPQADFPRLMIHAVYVVFQSGIEVILARRMLRAAVEGEELALLVARVGRGERILLDVAGVPCRTPAALGLQRMLLRVAEAVDTVRGASHAMEASSSEIARGNQDLSMRTEDNAVQLQRTAFDVSDLATGAQDAAARAAQASRLAVDGSDIVRSGQAVVGDVVATMREIEADARRVAEIVAVIDGIAFQTNILALNAAVEAARAGEQGRGFAVVAAEVRALATRSAAASREIRGLIASSVQRVDRGGALVEQAGSTMQEVVGAIGQVTAILQELNAASREQATRAARVNEAVTRMDHATQQNAALVEEIAAAADSLKSQAHELVAAVAVFDHAGSPAAAAPAWGEAARWQPLLPAAA